MLAIVGPTASGKSALALPLAEELHAEILSCDSVQVYRGFVIGCAKPTGAERNRVRHHLIDLVDWHEPFDAALYRRAALDSLGEIRARNGRAWLVGGTGLYLRALRLGLIDTPPADLALRAALEASEHDDPGSLYRELQRIDPETAALTEPLNLVRVVRALEIYRQTGKQPSLLRASHRSRGEEVPMRVVALRWPREELRRRIEARTTAMLREGLVDEVKELLGHGVDPGCRPMRSVGYRQVVEGLARGDGEAALVEAIIRATWDYARRQTTWFKKERNVTWLDVTSLAAAVKELRSLILSL